MNVKPTNGSQTHQRVDSWKSIAQHLGRSSRTVQRWHAKYNLPVHRLGGESGSVFAYAEELDHWMRYRGLPAATEPSEFGVPLLIASASEREGVTAARNTLDFSAIPASAKARSAELVALASKMWETLSYRNLSAVARILREAIETDPCNAAAFAGLSSVLIAEGLWSIVRPQAAYTAAKMAVRRALEIAPEQPEAHCAAAWLMMICDRDWEGARRGFDRACDVKPLTTRAMVGRAVLHLAEGSLGEAAALLLEAEQSCALSCTAMAWYCWSQYLAGEYANALLHIRQYRASGRSGPVVDAIEALCLIQLEEPLALTGRLGVMAAASPQNAMLLGALGYLHGMLGNRKRATEILSAMIDPKVHSMHEESYAIALVLIGLDQIQEAIKRLEQAYRDGSLWSLGYRSDPILATLENDRHYQLFMDRVRYPEGAGEELEFVG